MELVEQHGEFVSTETRENVGAPQQSLHPLRDLDEEHVSGAVPERVVDHLEPVDVEVQHADDRALFTRLRHRALQRVNERGSVGEAGQLVVHGPPGELRVRIAEPGVGLVVVLAQLQLADHHAVHFVMLGRHHDEVDGHRESEQLSHAVCRRREHDRDRHEQRDLRREEVEATRSRAHHVRRRDSAHEEHVHRAQVDVLRTRQREHRRRSPSGGDQHGADQADRVCSHLLTPAPPPQVESGAHHGHDVGDRYEDDEGDAP